MGRRPLSPRALIWGTVFAGAAAAIALLAYLYPRGGQESGGAGGPAAGVPAGGTTASAAPPTGPATTPPPAAEHKPLTDIDPSVGAAFVEVTGPATLTLPCATGGTGDRSHEVRYELFGAYTRFSATATTGGDARPEAEVQVEVLVDSIVRDNAVFARGEQGALDVEVDDAAVLALRITCDSPQSVVTVGEAFLATAP